MVLLGCGRGVSGVEALLEKAIHWRIGNGWLPRPFSFKPISPAPTACPLGIWNEHVIEQLFLPMDKELIYSIPFSTVNINMDIGWDWILRWGNFKAMLPVLSSLLKFDFMCFLVLAEFPCIILSQTGYSSWSY
ncbi:hypothetical protein TorRG33x02_087160 [Trema orientale]|uniref:Uncharacterized protein n=1 Tax=Trema orientale TaxID=63057 RepID=A0A2P5FCP3_TREOI|nr:hypothetical protein TorRG33x02_087160 [Trema orientale]